MNRALLWILILAGAAAFAVFTMTHDNDAITGLLRRDDLSSVSVKIVMAVFAGGLALALFRERFSRALQAALAWVAISLLLMVGYAYRFELRDVSDRVLAELMPGRAATRGNQVEIVRGRSADFAIAAQVNGAHASMVLDTGASAVVLTQETAKAAGLPMNFLNYSVAVETANGRTRAAPVVLERLTVGGITAHAVQALIAQPGQLKTNLLGMSFLNRLESWQVRGDKLVLRGAT